MWEFGKVLIHGSVWGFRKDCGNCFHKTQLEKCFPSILWQAFLQMETTVFLSLADADSEAASWPLWIWWSYKRIHFFLAVSRPMGSCCLFSFKYLLCFCFVFSFGELVLMSDSLGTYLQINCSFKKNVCHWAFFQGIYMLFASISSP